MTCPLIPELVTEGDTIEEALENVRDALSAVMEAYEDLNRPLPPILQRLAVDTGAPSLMETVIPA